MKYLRASVFALVVLVLGVGLGLYFSLARSVPQLDGTLTLAGLGGPVTVERDAAGVPTITAADRLDLARATGFIHAQERFFQMDLMRRAAAGELSALIGPAALEFDRGRRLHRMRSVAEQSIALAHADERALIEAYAAGVNAGISSMASRPFEYLVLRKAPRPWTMADTVLVTGAMWFDLTDESGQRERDLARLRAALPAAVVDLLMPRATAWDSPLRPDQPQPVVPALPGAEVIDLRRGSAVVVTHAAAASPESGAEAERVLGSNNFAVAGALTADHRAILAGDMHLSLAVPNTWFRARLRAPGLDITGVTLPGTPLMVAGSNGHVAWAFTNSYGDWTDLRRLEIDGERYRTAQGWAAFQVVHERIVVAGGEPQDLVVRETRWGPVFEDAGGTYAIEWLAHRPAATNLALWRAERATSVAELVALAPHIGIPPQNMAMADSSGHIGWTIAGRIPRRAPGDGRSVRAGTEPEAPAGYLTEADGIAVVDPPGARVWSANARVASGNALEQIGDGGYDLATRARQIRDDLQARERFSEADLLAVQLDDRALFMAGWRELLLAELTPARVAGSALRTEARRLVEGWSGHAAVDDAGYRIVRGFRLAVRKQLLEAIEAPLRATDPEFLAFDGAFEGALWRMVHDRPPNFVPRADADWDAFLLGALDASLPAADPVALAQATWGEANRARIAHPLSGAVPGFHRLFDMPATALPGDSNMPRVQTRSFGASQRMVVSPGHEAEGFFHMPGGQSGHPLAPYYGAGHADWEQGRPTPFLPGATRWALTLRPGARQDGAITLSDAAAPAAAGSLAPRLAEGTDGALLASWLEPRGRGHALRYARFGAGGWDAARDAAHGDDWFVNWADTPGVFEAGERLVAHWLRKRGGSPYAYDVVVASSGDRGATWSAPLVPHHDGVAAEHGFVSQFLTTDGFGLVWLDGRAAPGGDEHAAAAGHDAHDGNPAHGGAGMTIRSARFDAAGHQLDEQLVDDFTCDCCPTDIAATAAGPLLVYRDRTPEEIRDIFVARLSSAGWDEPRAVGVDAWHMTGCPVNGPAVAALGARTVVAWFTAQGDRPRVQLAWSADSGASFGAPTRIDGGAGMGRVELVMVGDHALVFWLERSGVDDADLMARRAWPDGTLGAPRVLAHSAGARSSGFPRAVATGAGVFLAWTEVAASGAKQVRVARLVE